MNRSLKREEGGRNRSAANHHTDSFLLIYSRSERDNGEKGSYDQTLCSLHYDLKCDSRPLIGGAFTLLCVEDDCFD